ncbi:hypothetical protein AURDEDRAFT_73414, partial [Auricularia subglabra TFB-10046 SS5]
MSSHVCDNACARYVALFLSNSRLVNSRQLFPPPPMGPEGLSGISDGYCGRLKPEYIEEEGCAVCGKLTSTRTLEPISTYCKQIDELLCAPGITRIARDHQTEPIRHIEVPLLAPDCAGVCSDCAVSLRKDKVPKFSLANGIWVGDVPNVLKRLNYAERLLVARSRHHKCLVRISKSGMNRLNGNMICYPNPYPKLY